MGYLQSYRTPGGQRRFSQDQIERFVGSLEQRKGADVEPAPYLRRQAS
jgi:hypothetical protein